MKADSSGPTALEMKQRLDALDAKCAEHEKTIERLDVVAEVMRDYFENDREGWKRGWKAWARRARAALRVTCDCNHGTDPATLTTCNKCEGTGTPVRESPFDQAGYDPYGA